MKSAFGLLVLVLLLVTILAGCAPGSNQYKGTANEHDVVRGFWLGLWQGFIAPFIFVGSLVKGNRNLYEVHNNGACYNFGYLLGLGGILGGSGKRTAVGSNPTVRARLASF